MFTKCDICYIKYFWHYEQMNTYRSNGVLSLNKCITSNSLQRAWKMKILSHILGKKNNCYSNNLLKKLIKTRDIYEYTTGNLILFLITISGIMRLTNEYIFSDICEILRNLILETRNHWHNHLLTRLRRLSDINENSFKSINIKAIIINRV